MLNKTLDAVLAHLAYTYRHNRTADLSNYAVSRDNRNARGLTDLSAQQNAHVADASYANLADTDDRSLLEVIQEVADYRMHRLQGREVPIIQRLAALLRMPCPANRLTLPSIRALQEVLLRPDEKVYANFVETTASARCFRCGHVFQEGDATTFHTPEWSGEPASLVVCAGCEPPSSQKCAHPECTSRITPSYKTKFCALHTVAQTTASRRGAVTKRQEETPIPTGGLAMTMLQPWPVGYNPEPPVFVEQFQDEEENF